MFFGVGNEPARSTPHSFAAKRQRSAGMYPDGALLFFLSYDEAHFSRKGRMRFNKKG